MILRNLRKFLLFTNKNRQTFWLTLPLLHKAHTMTRGTLNILLVLVHALRGGYGVWSCRTVWIPYLLPLSYHKIISSFKNFINLWRVLTLKVTNNSHRGNNTTCNCLIVGVFSILTNNNNFKLIIPFGVFFFFFFFFQTLHSGCKLNTLFID